jgi:hypothetical protein
MITYEDISENIDDDLRPWLDRKNVDESQLTDDQFHWRRNGFLIKRKFLSEDIIDKYVKIREKSVGPGGWSSPSPYEHIPELRDLCLDKSIINTISSLIGDELVLHLNLTGWVSTERDWHQDDYLNHPNVNGWYIAVWIALGDITEHCGPFEFIPTSHKWPVLRGQKVRSHMDPNDAKETGWGVPDKHWTITSQKMVSEIVDKKKEELNCSTQNFIAKKGDVLFWHSCLQHRGTKATKFNLERRAVISHYSEISHQVLIPPNIIRTHTTGGKYAEFGNPLK